MEARIYSRRTTFPEQECNTLSRKSTRDLRYGFRLSVD